MYKQVNEGFEVAMRLLENQLNEVKQKTQYYKDEQKMLTYRQNYELNALTTVLGKLSYLMYIFRGQ